MLIAVVRYSFYPDFIYAESRQVVLDSDDIHNWAQCLRRQFGPKADIVIIQENIQTRCPIDENGIIGKSESVYCSAFTSK